MQKTLATTAELPTFYWTPYSPYFDGFRGYGAETKKRCLKPREHQHSLRTIVCELVSVTTVDGKVENDAYAYPFSHSSAQMTSAQQHLKHYQKNTEKPGILLPSNQMAICEISTIKGEFDTRFLLDGELGKVTFFSITILLSDMATAAER